MVERGSEGKFGGWNQRPTDGPWTGDSCQDPRARSRMSGGCLTVADFVEDIAPAMIIAVTWTDRTSGRWPVGRREGTGR